MNKYYEVGEKVVLINTFSKTWKPWYERDHYTVERLAKVGTHGVYWVTYSGEDLLQLGGHSVCNQEDYTRFLQDVANQELMDILKKHNT